MADVLTCRDRRILAERLTISSRQILPRVTISNSALKEIFRLYRTHAETNRGRLHLQNASVLGYLHGESATRSAKQLTLSAVASPKVRSRASNPSQVKCAALMWISRTGIESTACKWRVDSPNICDCEPIDASTSSGMSFT